MASRAIKLLAERTDTVGVRLALTHKFVLGSLVVSGAVVALPAMIRAWGVDFPMWGSIFVALGVGAGIGFFLSRILGRKFEILRQVTEAIRAGDLSVDVPVPEKSFLSDETDDLALSIRGMLAKDPHQRDYSGDLERTRVLLRRSVKKWKRPSTERAILRAWRVILAITVEVRKNNNPSRLKSLRAELLKITRR